MWARTLLFLLVMLALPAAALADGELLNGFGNQGTQQVDVIASPGLSGPNPGDRGDAITPGRSQDESFVAGWTEPGFQGDLADQSDWQQQQITLTRYDGQGHDPNFRSAPPPGYVHRGVVASFPGFRSQGLAVAYRSDPNLSEHRILVGGMIAPNFTNQWDIVVLDYTRQGTLDPDFGTGGVFRTDPDGGVQDSFVGAMQMDRVNKRLLIAGPAMEATPQNAAAGRPTRGWVFVGKLNPLSGQRDTEYGVNGFWRMLPVLAGNEPVATLVHDMALDTVRKRVYVCGSARFANGDTAGFVTASFLSHPVGKGPQALTRRWNGGRIRWFNTRNRAEQCNGIDITRDGLTVVAVTQGVPDSTPDRILVSEFRTTGSFFDPFGGDGEIRLGLANGSLAADAVAFRQPGENRVYVPGIDWGATGLTGDRRVLLAALRQTNGTLDTAFDGVSSANGLLRTNVLVGGVDQAFDMAATPAHLTLAGRAGPRLLVARYRP